MKPANPRAPQDRFNVSTGIGALRTAIVVADGCEPALTCC